jgi:GxxExxY protein
MELNDITAIIVDEAFHLHENLGPGLLESVYEAVLAHRLIRRGLKVTRQVSLPFRCDGVSFDEGFRADLLVEDVVIVELKATEQNHAVHARQVITYLKISGRPVGLLINFGLLLFKDGVKRLVSELPNQQSLPNSRSAAPRVSARAP